jgi:benzoate/toluate 1,2-dioxygenase subunit beta
MNGTTPYDLRAVQAFLHNEARLADEHQYAEWEALWTDDAVYWVPAGGANTDPDKTVSYIYDNRNRIRTRIGLLLTGERFAQTPVSGLARVVSNIEVDGTEPNGDLLVSCAFVLIEYRRGHLIWAGRNTFKLRPDGDSFKMAYKKVVLVDSDDPIRKLGFIL